MSHIVSIKTEVRDPTAVAAACQRLGLPEPVQGTANTGWVTPSYLVRAPGGGGPTTDPLAWCPPKGTAAPHPSGRLRLATWNPEEHTELFVAPRLAGG